MKHKTQTESPESFSPPPPASTPGSLTEAQQRLVHQNIGLVSVPLRRLFGAVRRPSRAREWDDLFQEGCLGLIHAAATYDPARGIPFPAFAVLRIQNAVTRAAARTFQTLSHPPGTRLVAVPLSRVPPRRRASAECHDVDTSEPDTVGRRLRDKYERAVRWAAVRIARGGSARRSVSPLLARILHDRLLVPDEDHRVALRQLARETDTPCASAARAEKLLAAETRRLLLADPEFRLLRRMARRHPRGIAAPCDSSAERRLRNASAIAFTRGLRSTSKTDRAMRILLLEELSAIRWDDVIRRRIRQMPGPRRERLFHLTDAVAQPSAPARARRRRTDGINAPGDSDGVVRPPRAAPTPASQCDAA